MKQVIIKKGVAVVEQLPAPKIGAGEVLVSVRNSCISVGTELANMQNSSIPLWKRALNQPEKILVFGNTIVERGIKSAVQLIQEKNNAIALAGYSLSGEIVEVGDDIHDLFIGQRVSCAGGQYAQHADYVRVSRNLCVPIPDGVNFDSASTVALGAIALQGVRRAQPQLGEIFLVVGLGIIGQLTSQILKANGCKVIGSDPDSARLDLAKSLGVDFGILSLNEDIETILRLTAGHGVDCVIVTAATASNEVISTAFRACRRKGRVVLVGDVGLNLKREDFYIKEIDFFISSSYGPGRYDFKYEEGGLDYPIGYVRWTENRNMSEYLRQISIGAVRIEPLISARFSIDQAEGAYEAISSKEKPLLVMLEYSSNSEKLTQNFQQKITSAKRELDGSIGIAVMGVGSFAQSSHLPNIRSLSSLFNLEAVVSRTGITAKAIGDKFKARYISTDQTVVLADPNVEAILIATRHNLHGSLALEALRAGKHVLVEKPLTIDQGELKLLQDFFEKSDQSCSTSPILLTGYNRRFSPHAKQMKMLVQERTSPFIFNYRMNAGFLPRDHWVHGTEGGGRNLGEACHIYDLFLYLAGSSIESISVDSIKPTSNYYGRNDNFIVTFHFVDGSIASLTYTSMGHKNQPKEMAELYVDGKIAFLNDYKSLVVHGQEKLSLNLRVQDKGFHNELKEFAAGIKSGNWPISWNDQLQVSNVAFLIEKLL
jgi:predicted dehydrogenase